MRIHFESSGGYVPLELVYNVDTDALPEDQARELHDLVESSGFFQFQAPATGQSFPDVTTYTLRIDDGRASQTVRATDVTGGPLMPLLSHLKNLAIQSRG